MQYRGTVRYLREMILCQNICDLFPLIGISRPFWTLFGTKRILKIQHYFFFPVLWSSKITRSRIFLNGFYVCWDNFSSQAIFIIVYRDLLQRNKSLLNGMAFLAQHPNLFSSAFLNWDMTIPYHWTTWQRHRGVPEASCVIWFLKIWNEQVFNAFTFEAWVICSLGGDFKYVCIVTLRWGSGIQFDSRIFFRWVGSTTK